MVLDVVVVLPDAAVSNLPLRDRHPVVVHLFLVELVILIQRLNNFTSDMINYVAQLQSYMMNHVTQLQSDIINHVNQLLSDFHSSTMIKKSL